MNNTFIHKIVSWIGFIIPFVERKYIFKRYFSKLQLIGDNLKTYGSVTVIEPKRITVGNNVKIRRNVILDGRGGIVIGDNVELDTSANLLSIEEIDNKKEFNPIVVQPNTLIERNKTIIPGSFVGKCDYNSGLLEYSGNLVFIVGTGRSGTNAIANYINQDVNSICYHDPFPHIGIWSCDVLYREKSDAEIIDNLKQLYNSINSKNKKLIGQSDQKFGALIPHLKSVFPKAKFIWLIRNGMDFVNSAYPRGWFRNEEFGYSKNMTEFIDAKAKPSDMHAACRVNGLKVGAFSEKDWKVMTAFERNCWYWTYWNSLIENHLKNINAKDKLFLRLEELEVNKEALSNFLHLDIKQNIEKTNAANYAKSSISDWNNDMKKLFDKHCFHTFKKWYPEYN